MRYITFPGKSEFSAHHAILGVLDVSKKRPLKKSDATKLFFQSVPFSMATFHEKLVGLNVKIDGEEDFFDSCLAVTRAVKIEME
jgi:hypothetical protein